MIRVDRGVVALAVALAGCFVDTGNGATVASSTTSTAEATTGEPGGTGTTSVDPPTTSGTCASACGTSDATSTLTPTEGEATTVTMEATTEDAPGVLMAMMPVSVPGAFALARGRFDSDAADDLVVASRDAMAPGVGVLHGPDLVSTDVTANVTAEVLVADLDGDQDDDFVLVQPGAPGQVVSALWANGGVMGGASFELPDGCETPRGAAIGDIDGDNRVDVVVACEAGSIAVLLNAGAGVFEPSSPLAVTGEPGAMALADVVDDSPLDLLVVDPPAQILRLIPGTSAGTFDTDFGQELPVDTPIALAVGDIDADGLPEVVVAGTSGNCTLLRIAGGEVMAFTFECGADTRDIKLADLDGDGRVDIATANSGGITVARNLGESSFVRVDYPAEAASRLAIGDFDGDARLDVAISTLNAVQLFLQSS